MVSHITTNNLRRLSRRMKIENIHIPELLINCSINKFLLLDVIKFTFLQYCHFSVFGYNNQTDEFWAKKIINNKYLLYFTLKINYCDLNSSNIIIFPLVGDQLEFKNLLSLIQNNINLYQSNENNIYYKAT